MSDRARVAVRRRRLLVLVACWALALTSGCAKGLAPTSTPGPGTEPSTTPEDAETPGALHLPSPTAVATTVPVFTRIVEPTPSLTLRPVVVATASATRPALVPGLVTATPNGIQAGTYTISDVVLFDGAHNRLYAHGRLGENDRTLVLSATDGSPLAAYKETGALGLDEQHRWLYVDAAGTELAILNADTGETIGTVLLPSQEGSRPRAIPPQVDPSQGQVLAFRQNLVYVADGATGRIVRTIPFEFEKSDDCRTGQGPYPIEWATYDPSARILYVSYLSYVCTPWYGFGIVSYDLASGQQIAHGGDYPFYAAADDGYLYGSSWHRFGIGYLWAWRDGTPSLRSSDWNSQPRFLVDRARNVLYGEVGGSLGVFNAQSMELLFEVQWPVEGQLAGFDPFTDQLYFLQDGDLRLVSTGRIQRPVAQNLMATAVPTVPVDLLALSGGWPADRTVVGIWGKAQPMDRCYAFAQQGGSLLLSNDGGQSWAMPGAGLPACRYVSTVVVSPDYAHDQTLLMGIVGMGVFRSNDGGQLWEAASVGLGSMNVQELILSPGFATDHTAFLRVATGGPYRSTDGGKTWQPLGLPAQPPVDQLLLSPGFLYDGTAFVRLSTGELYRSRDAGLTWQGLSRPLRPVALSPEFDRDGTILGTTPDGTELYISRDGGDGWTLLGETPAAAPIGWLSLAPLFGKWGVAFARARDPLPAQSGSGSAALYRTADGGLTWRQLRLPLGEPLGIPENGSMTWLYAPDVELNRPIYLLVVKQDWAATPPTKRGHLYRSGDGGITWKEAQVPAGGVPTAVTLSPQFAVDRLVFIGTADGHVLVVHDDTMD